MSTKTKSLCFYTTGEGFTGLLHGFWNEYNPYSAIEMLSGNDLPYELKLSILLGGHIFEGDSRDELGLSIVKCPKGQRPKRRTPDEVRQHLEKSTSKWTGRMKEPAVH